MPTFHHANLGVPPELAEAQTDFLISILGYRHLEPPEAARGFGARWFVADDGTEIHLSLDEDHRPAAMAHTALVVGDDSAAIEERLTAAGIAFKAGEFMGLRIVNCKDPAGNSWELRS